MVDIRCKLQALQVMHVRHLLYHDFVKWHAFANYWLGFTQPIRNIKPEMARNSIPHSEERPMFYACVHNAIKQFQTIGGIPQLESLESMKVKTVYWKFLDAQYEKPTIETKFPLVEWSELWKNIRCPAIAPEIRDFLWKCAHNILPVNTTLYRFNIVKSPRCRFCMQIETLDHLLFDCDSNQDLWLYIENLLSKLTKIIIILHRKDVLELDFLPTIPACFHSISLVIVSQMKYLIWQRRNKLVFDQTFQTSSEIIDVFKNKLYMHCKADYLRWQPKLFHKLWCQNCVIASIASGQLVWCL